MRVDRFEGRWQKHTKDNWRNVLDQRERQLEIGQLLVVIECKQPIPALLLGEFLSALSKDYRKLNRGRTLVVSRVEEGSIWIILVDLAQASLPYVKDTVAAAKGTKAIVDLGKSIIGLIKTLKGGEDGPENLPAKTPDRTVEKIVKIAAETGNDVRIG